MDRSPLDHVLGLKRNPYHGTLFPRRMHSINDRRALMVAVMPSPSWRQSGACDVHHGHMASDPQCQAWKEKEIEVGYSCSTYARSKVARLRQRRWRPQKTALQTMEQG